MLDYLRNLTKSDEEKRQEMLTAYLDGELTPKQQQQVQGDLAHDQGFATELNQMRLLQQEMRQLPQRRVRRNFTLEPALYGRPKREPLVQAYPLLRTATVMAAFLFIFALAVNVFLSRGEGAMSAAEPIVMEAPSQEQAVAEAVIEEAEAEALLMEAEPLEEGGEAPQILEQVTVDAEFEMAEDDAGSAFIERDMEVEEAAPLDSPTLKQEAERAAEDGSMAAVPTMAAEEESQAAPKEEEVTTAAIEPAELPPASLPAGAGEGQSATAGVDNLTNDEVVPSELNGFALLALILGIVFVVLVLLTVLARRRL